MDWIKEKSPVVKMVFDKPTNLFAWVTKDGRAYAVRKPSVFSYSQQKLLTKSSKSILKIESMATRKFGKAGYSTIIRMTTPYMLVLMPGFL
jgi:hypothetical protein